MYFWVANIMRFKSGFKALAIPASNLPPTASPCPCSLVFRCDNAAEQATLLLVATIDSQTFALQYDADQLLADPSTGLRSGSDHVSPAQMLDIMRDRDDKKPDVKTLTLVIKQLCPVWCPPSSLLVEPRAPSQLLTELMKATSLHIIFDYKYIRNEHRSMFKAFSKATRGLSSHRVDQLLTGMGLRKLDWNVFGPEKAADTAGAPPAYSLSRKRSRQGKSSASTELAGY